MTKATRIAARFATGDTRERLNKVEELMKIGGSFWEASYDGYWIMYYSKQGSHGDESHITATLDNVDSLLEDGTAKLTLNYSEGADYEGSFGRREKEIRIRSGERDLKNGLKQGERLFKQWERERERRTR